MGNVENRCGGVGIDGHDAVGTLHTGGKLHRAGNAQGDDQLGFDGSAGQTNLVLGIQNVALHQRTGAGKAAPQQVSQLFCLVQQSHGAAAHCHDDLCLTDKLRKSMPEASDSVRMRVARLAQTIVFTSQGTPFIFAGEEIFRDKKGVHNSYCSPDDINAIDWNIKAQNREQFEYYRNLIDLRRSHPAFRMATAEEVAKNIVFDNVKLDNVVSYSIKNNANGDEWKEIKVIFNGSEAPVKVNIPKGDWTIIAANGKLDKNGLGKSKGGKVEAAPQAAFILYRTK